MELLRFIYEGLITAQSEDTEGQMYQSKLTPDRTQQRGNYERRTERVGTISEAAEVYYSCFPFPNRVIDRSLSAMNGCEGEGGKNPELQVTDHGSDTARMQTGRGGKIYSFRAGGEERKEVYFKSPRTELQSKQS